MKLKIPTHEDAIEEANAKGITLTDICNGIPNISTQTVYAYFRGERVSTRTQERIINYINSK